MPRGIDQVSVDTGALEQNLRFPGQWFQAETGLHQNWMRDYDPTTGRYLQADPLGLVDGASVYGYVRQGPTRWTDPRGLTTLAVGGADLGANPVYQVAYENGWTYYRHNDEAKLIKDILDLSAEKDSSGCGSGQGTETIKVVGHSWGAESAARAARTLRGKVDLLVTVDGVSAQSTPHPAGIAKRWINITATRGAGYDWSDFVADLGSGGRKARESRYRNAEQRPVPAHHWEFRRMLHDSQVLPLLQ